MLVPLFTVKWQFADDWRLDAGLTDVATTGYGAEVKWLFSDTWDFGFGLQYHKARFRIASPDGSGGEGAGQEKAATLYADATWHATPKVDVDGFVGFAAGGNLAAYNNARDKVCGIQLQTGRHSGPQRLRPVLIAAQRIDPLGLVPPTGESSSGVPAIA